MSIVVSPLKSLMSDQVLAARNAGIAAVALMSHDTPLTELEGTTID